MPVKSGRRWLLRKDSSRSDSPWRYRPIRLAGRPVPWSGPATHRPKNGRPGRVQSQSTEDQTESDALRLDADAPVSRGVRATPGTNLVHSKRRRTKGIQFLPRHPAKSSGPRCATQCPRCPASCPEIREITQSTQTKSSGARRFKKTKPIVLAWAWKKVVGTRRFGARDWAGFTIQGSRTHPGEGFSKTPNSTPSDGRTGGLYGKVGRVVPPTMADRDE
jgi:hypothetical protein